MKKKLISLVLALCLSLGLAVSAAAASTGYSDVPENHWAAGTIRRATELGLFQGVGGGKFGLGRPITRAAFVTALNRMFRWEETVPTAGTFTDVAPTAWYCAAVETAVQHGAVVAAGKTFRPTENITREEMATMLVRGLGYASLAGAASSYGCPFTDVTVSRGFVTVAYDLGIVGGVGEGKFAPDAAATREQAATVLVRVYDRLYAPSRQLTDSAGYAPLSVATPEASDKTEIPTTPLEPMAALYTALRDRKGSGADMGKTALTLTAGGIRTLVSNGRILASGPISREETEEILAGKGVRTYYSTRYESAYCIYEPNSYQTATLWYQSEESLAAKLQLARLFGVTAYTLG